MPVGLPEHPFRSMRSSNSPFAQPILLPLISAWVTLKTIPYNPPNIVTLCMVKLGLQNTNFSEKNLTIKHCSMDDVHF